MENSMNSMENSMNSSENSTNSSENCNEFNGKLQIIYYIIKLKIECNYIKNQNEPNQNSN